MADFDRRFFLARARTRLTPIIAHDQPRFVKIGQRRYFERLPYALPNDPVEAQRLDFQHSLLRQLRHANYAAPLQQVDAILDVGCGTGRWVRETARELPQANVVGLDMLLPSLFLADGEPVTSGLMPENTIFLQGNCLAGLPFAAATFDFVHMRLMGLAIPQAQWSFVLHELVRVTRPGGWVELFEMELPSPVTPASRTIAEWMKHLVSRVQVDPTVGAQLGDWLQRAGIRQIQTQVLPVTLGTQGGHLGTMAATNVLSLLQGIREPLVGRTLTTADEFAWTLERLHQDIETVPLTQTCFGVVGQKH